jgi:drug/metabolite transporter (DMT)-like permease
VEAPARWARWPVILVGVAGAVIFVLAYLKAAWVLVAVGALMLAANVLMMGAMKHKSRRPVSSRSKHRHSK